VLGSPHTLHSCLFDNNNLEHALVLLLFDNNNLDHALVRRALELDLGYHACQWRGVAASATKRHIRVGLISAEGL
jgi:hypothetical protein